MAAEVSAMGGVNGYAPHQGYGGIEQSQQQHNAYNTPSNYAQQAPAAAAAPAPQNEIPKDEVGWYFVEQYYTTLSRSPEKLYLFYNKRSQFVSGQETDKVAVCVGQRAINDRIKDLDFQDAKVRVTNVDSQASDSNIVIQVIGEISNKSEPPKKFTQTFVLATQTNGYFVLNDIFRYLIEEEDEEPEQEQEAAPAQQEEEIQQAPAAESGYQEPPSTAEPTEPKTLTSSIDPVAVESDAKQVDKELETKLLKEEKPEEEAPKTNGVTEEKAAEPAPEAEPETAPEAPTAEPEQPAVLHPTDEPAVEQEKPKDPSPTPAPAAQQAPPQPAAPPKPAAPKTWASLAASAHRVATPAAPAAPAQSAQQTQARATTAPATKPAAPTPAAAPVPTAPAAQREDTASPAQDEWNTVSSSHNRQQSRAANQQQGQQEGPQNRGYIKGVHETVNADELRRHLAQFGEITYFDVARQKNCAFVDFKTADGYQAAVNANPHTLGENKLFVEERRVRPGSTPYIPRGQYQGGRGGRGGAQGQGAGRGNFQGQQRGGAYQGARGSRGGAQAGRGRGGAEA